MGHPRPLFGLFQSIPVLFFGLFQTNINIIFTANQCENVHPVYGAGIRTHDLQIASLWASAHSLYAVYGVNKPMTLKNWFVRAKEKWGQIRI